MEQDEELHLEQETVREKVAKMSREEAVKKLQGLVDKDIAKRAGKYGVTIWQQKPVMNKGWFGHLIQRILGLPLDTRQESDFDDWELKTTSVYRRKNGEIAPKETVQITMINKDDILKNEFHESHLYKKLNSIVLVARLVTGTWDDTGFVYKVAWFDLKKDKELSDAIEQDYDLVRKTLQDHKNDNDLSCLPGEMGVYVQPRTKGEGHGSTTRAFYMREALVARILGLNKDTPPLNL